MPSQNTAQLILKMTVNKDALDYRLKETELRLDAKFERVNGELKLNRWMLGMLLAGVTSLVIKAFFSL